MFLWDPLLKTYYLWVSFVPFLSNFSFTLHVSDTHGFKRIDLRDLPQRAAIVEKYRWPFTMALQAIFTLFCLLLFVSSYYDIYLEAI